MANRFWVGGTGNWDASSTTNWSATTGGSSGAAVPTASDDVIFDSSSGTGTCTLNANRPCKSVTSTATNIAWSHGAFNLSVGTSSAGAGNVAIDMSGFTSRTYASGSTISFVSTSATQQTIKLQSACCSLTFNGAGGSWLLSDAAACTSGSVTSFDVTVTAGTFNSNNQAITCRAFLSNNSNTRTITLGSSAVTLTHTGTAFNIATTTGLTWTSNTATFAVGAGNSVTINNAATLTGTTFSATASGTPILTGAGTIPTFTRTCTSTPSDGLAFNSDYTITNLNVTGFSSGQKAIFKSNTGGTQHTITSTTPTLTNVLFSDTIAAGTTPWTGTGLQDGGNNTGITFDATSASGAMLLLLGV